MVNNDEKIFDLDKFLQALYKVSQSQINKKEPHGPPSGPPENPQILNSDHRAFISLIINHLRMSQPNINQEIKNIKAQESGYSEDNPDDSQLRKREQPDNQVHIDLGGYSSNAADHNLFFKISPPKQKKKSPRKGSPTKKYQNFDIREIF